MGRIKASCGHWLTEEEDMGIEIEYADFYCDRSYPDGGMTEVIMHGNFCSKCAEEKWLKKAIKRAKELKKEWNM